MIKIKGHSNFDVKCELIKDKYYILKSCDIINSSRLKNQMVKQDNLYKNNFLINCHVPKIYKKEQQKGYIIYHMEYIKNSINLIEFLSKENSIKIDWLCRNIIKIIECYILKCENKKIEKSILISKIDSISNNIKKNRICAPKIKDIEKYLNFIVRNMNNVLNIAIPMGICHGDMTFSNILVDTNNMYVYLIDFLDSFIETPLFDIIKIRQDTYFNWTINMCDFTFDKNKAIMTLNYIDLKVNNYFEKYDWYKKCYQYFQMFNILRILQYCKEENIRDKLIEYLNELI